MTVFYAILSMLAGGALLMLGGDWLVKSATRIAAWLRVSPLIIALTVVAFGTSAPELAVCLHAALTDSAAIAVGSVIGSNVANLLLILGTAAIVAPLPVARNLLRVDVPCMVLLTLLAALALRDGGCDRWEGATMVGVLVVYLAICIAKAFSSDSESQGNSEAATDVGGAPEENDLTVSNSDSLTDLLKSFLLGVFGLVFLTIGARLLTDGAVQIARELGISELVIGLTIVATGTSLPELVTTVVAGLRGERDVALGNVIGSNILNIGCVLGSTTMIAPIPSGTMTSMRSYDLPMLVVVTLMAVSMIWSGRIVTRREGAVLLAGYVGYLVLILYL